MVQQQQTVTKLSWPRSRNSKLKLQLKPQLQAWPPSLLAFPAAMSAAAAANTTARSAHAMRRGSSSPTARCIRDLTKIANVATVHDANMAGMRERSVDRALAYARRFCNDPRATAGVGTGTGVGASVGVSGATLQIFTGAKGFNCSQASPGQQLSVKKEP